MTSDDPKSLEYKPAPDKFPRPDQAIPERCILFMDEEQFGALCLHQKLGYLFQELKAIRMYIDERENQKSA